MCKAQILRMSGYRFQVLHDSLLMTFALTSHGQALVNGTSRNLLAVDCRYGISKHFEKIP